MDEKTLKQEYDRCHVRVYLINGTSLCGTATFLEDKWLALENDDGRRAVCNLDHVVSICRTK